MEALIREREAGGPFTSRSRTCAGGWIWPKANRRALEALLRTGSLDGLGANRATLMDRLSAAMQLGDQNTRSTEAGQNDMFGLATDARANLPPARAPPSCPTGARRCA